MEYGNVADFLQPALDFKAARRGDVFEIDAAERAGNQADCLHDFIHILGADANRERIHTGKRLEQRTFALHHRHARFRPDIAQTKNCGSIRNNGDQIRASGQFIGLIHVAVNDHARLGNARRIGERKIMAVIDGYAGNDLDFTLPLIVLSQRFFADIH